jgi:hypothetical protein
VSDLGVKPCETVHPSNVHTRGKSVRSHTISHLTEIELLNALRARGVELALCQHGELVLIGGASLSAAGLELVEEHRAMLVATVLGRLTGHAPGACSSCGAVAMVCLTNSSGTARWQPSVGWPRCRLTPRCTGRVIVAEADRLGVKRTPRSRPVRKAPP